MNIHQRIYALKNGKAVHISEVSRGLKCECICEKCEKPLIAKKGRKREHHFGHSAKTDCTGSAETILHLLAKEIFEELPNISLPQYSFEKSKLLKGAINPIIHRELIVSTQDFLISKVYVEKSESNFKPDVTLECNDKMLFVEVVVTNKVDRKKLRKIRKRGLPAIEIHLNFADVLLTRSELKHKLQKDIKSKIWLFHPKQREAEKVFFEKVRLARRKAKEPAINFKRVNANVNITKKLIANELIKPIYSTEDDRMRLEFFLRFNRQPNDDEAIKLASILYGNTAIRNQLTYASIKGRR